MGEQTKHLGDEIANTEGETTITVDGETFGLRQASVVQANEPDRARRARIQAARLAATAEHLNPLLDTLWRRCHDLSLELGYPDYKELYGTVRGLDYDHLRAELEGFLADTEGLYERVMDRLVRERLGVTLAQLDFADLPTLWRAEGFDSVFKADASFRRCAARSRAWASTSTPSPTCTSTPRSASSSRRAPSARRCACPDEIYLVVLPHGGQDDYGMLLHEAGHTEHFAHVRPDLAFEYRHLGDNAVTEGFAFTFDHLLLNRRWLADILDFEDSDDYVRFAAVNDLYFMRRYAAKLAYETTLHAQTGSLEACRREYSRRLSSATKVARAGGELPRRRGRRLLLRQLPARLDAGGRAAPHAAGELRHGLVRVPGRRRLAEGALGGRPAPDGRAAAAAARRRPAQHRSAAAPVRAGAGALTCERR